MAPPPSSLLGAPQSPAPESFSLPTMWTFWALRNRLTESHWILENRAVGKIRYVCVWRHRVGLGFQCASNLELENNCMYHFPEVLIMFLFLLIYWTFLPQPGLLRKVQGMGWYLEEANLAQVSTNILDFEVTPMHMVYEEICRDAKVSSFSNLNQNHLKLNQKWIGFVFVLPVQDLNLPVVGSQIVGLIPLKAMLDCADFYIQKENLFVVEEEHKIRLVG